MYLRVFRSGLAATLALAAFFSLVLATDVRSQTGSPSAYSEDTASEENLIFQYKTIGHVRVKTQDPQGFSKSQAAQALQMEAFKRYGTRAKGITNVKYIRIPDAYAEKRYSAASGDVVAWEQPVPTDPGTTDALSYPPDAEERAVTRPSQESLERREELYRAPLPRGQTLEGTALGETAGAQPSPDTIRILSNKDLIDYRFWTLGRVSARSKSNDGFTQEGAHRALQMEAFRQYGNQAQGLVNIRYKEKKKLPLLGKTIVEVAGDVVAWETPAEAPRSAAVQPRISRDVRVPAHGTTTAYARAPHDVVVVPSKDLYRLNFAVLGNVTVRNGSKQGFTEPGALKALKIEAFKRYGPQVRGISNVDFKRQTTLLFEKKITEAYADAVTWEPSTDIYRSARSSETYPSYYEGIGEGISSNYSTRTVRSGQIEILEGEETDEEEYRVLGPVAVEAPTRNGLKRSDVNRALRKKAFKEFGGKARYIVNVKYDKAQCLNCDGKYVRASGQVVSW